MADWSVLDSAVEYDVGWFRAGYDLVERPDGERARYYWVEPPDAAVVVALQDGDLVMVEQYRPRWGEAVLSCPAGGVDPEESFAAAGRRELREETGLRAGDVECLRTYRPSGWLRMAYGVVLARDLSPGDPDRDDGEFLAVRRVPLADAWSRLREDGAWGPTLVALLLAEREGALYS
ncbi:MAG: NUDIX hydrolase [Halobacteriales archaeon]